MTKTVGCIAVAIGAVVLLALVVGGAIFSTYNSLVTSEEGVEAQWAQVENVYQRRADLIPNLVATVRGAAEFESSTLQDVIEARSRVSQMTVDESVLDNPEAFARFEAAQNQLSSALSRLMLVVERYPELRAVAAFRDLQAQLEGTENRIANERRRFNEVARDFNAAIRRVPASWFISMLGWEFDRKPFFESQPGSEAPPEVEFDFDGE